MSELATSLYDVSGADFWICQNITCENHTVQIAANIIQHISAPDPVSFCCILGHLPRWFQCETASQPLNVLK